MLYQRIQMYLAAKTLAGRQLYVGQRVAARARNQVVKNWYYGIVKSLEPKVAVVVIDRGKREIRINQKKLVPVEKWEDSPNGERFDDLVLTDLEPKELYSQRKSVSHIGFQALRGMYWYVNAQVYNGVLPLDIPITRPGRSKVFGEVFPVWNWEKKRYDFKHLAISKQHHVISRIFTTMAHEAIHVFQLFDRTEYYPKGWNPHGDSFTYWIPIMKKRLGVNITTTSDRDNEVEVAPSTKKNGGKVNYCIMWQNSTGADERWFGVRTQDPNKIIYNIKRGALTSRSLIIYKVYDERIALHFARTRGEVIRTGKILPDTTVRFVQQNSEVFWKPGTNRPVFDKLFWLVYQRELDISLITYSTSKDEIIDYIKKNNLEYYVIYDMPPHKDNTSIIRPLNDPPHYNVQSLHRDYISKYGTAIFNSGLSAR